MSVVTARRNVESETGKRPLTITFLVVILGVLTIGALQGGIAMVANPTEPLGMTVEYLEGTPIDDYFLPGLFLLGIAAACVVAIAGLIFGWKWGWASRIESMVGYRWPWLATLAIGALLLTFEDIELFAVPFHPIMHPLLIGVSLAILLLPLTPSARRYLRAESRRDDRPASKVRS
ncbi:MAG: hypothetical protein WCE80_04405 [Acidimicrobiia bacterium]